MINPRELRVGNYVLFDKQVVMVKGVTENSVLLDGVVYDTGNPSNPHEYLPISVTDDRIQPIPLIDDILQKVRTRVPIAGGHAYKYYGSRVTFLIYEDEDGYYIGLNFHGQVIHITPQHIESLHQLQNIFFAQYGDEMDINEHILMRCIQNAVEDGLI